MLRAGTLLFRHRHQAASVVSRALATSSLTNDEPFPRPPPSAAEELNLLNVPPSVPSEVLARILPEEQQPVNLFLKAWSVAPEKVAAELSASTGLDSSSPLSFNRVLMEAILDHLRLPSPYTSAEHMARAVRDGERELELFRIASQTSAEHRQHGDGSVMSEPEVLIRLHNSHVHTLDMAKYREVYTVAYQAQRTAVRQTIFNCMYLSLSDPMPNVALSSRYQRDPTVDPALPGDMVLPFHMLMERFGNKAALESLFADESSSGSPSEAPDSESLDAHASESGTGEPATNADGEELASPAEVRQVLANANNMVVEHVARDLFQKLADQGVHMFSPRQAKAFHAATGGFISDMTLEEITTALENILQDPAQRADLLRPSPDAPADPLRIYDFLDLLASQDFMAGAVAGVDGGVDVGNSPTGIPFVQHNPHVLTPISLDPEPTVGQYLRCRQQAEDLAKTVMELMASGLPLDAIHTSVLYLLVASQRYGLLSKPDNLDQLHAVSPETRMSSIPGVSTSFEFNNFIRAFVLESNRHLSTTASPTSSILHGRTSAVSASAPGSSIPQPPTVEEMFSLSREIKQQAAERPMTRAEVSAAMDIMLKRYMHPEAGLFYEKMPAQQPEFIQQITKTQFFKDIISDPKRLEAILREASAVQKDLGFQPSDTYLTTEEQAKLRHLRGGLEISEQAPEQHRQMMEAGQRSAVRHPFRFVPSWDTTIGFGVAGAEDFAFAPSHDMQFASDMTAQLYRTDEYTASDLRTSVAEFRRLSEADRAVSSEYNLSGYRAQTRLSAYGQRVRRYLREQGLDEEADWDLVRKVPRRDGRGFFLARRHRKPVELLNLIHLGELREGTISRVEAERMVKFLTTQRQIARQLDGVSDLAAYIQQLPANLRATASQRFDNFGRISQILGAKSLQEADHMLLGHAFAFTVLGRRLQDAEMRKLTETPAQREARTKQEFIKTKETEYNQYKKYQVINFLDDSFYTDMFNNFHPEHLHPDSDFIPAIQYHAYDLPSFTQINWAAFLKTDFKRPINDPFNDQHHHDPKLMMKPLSVRRALADHLPKDVKLTKVQKWYLRVVYRTLKDNPYWSDAHKQEFLEELIKGYVATARKVSQAGVGTDGPMASFDEDEYQDDFSEVYASGRAAAATTTELGRETAKWREYGLTYFPPKAPGLEPRFPVHPISFSKLSKDAPAELKDLGSRNLRPYKYLLENDFSKSLVDRDELLYYHRIFSADRVPRPARNPGPSGRRGKLDFSNGFNFHYNQETMLDRVDEAFENADLDYVTHRQLARSIATRQPLDKSSITYHASTDVDDPVFVNPAKIQDDE
ncbi:hypothetical protein H696_00147 [Fonticula alba]|uniref:Uncharacterized protein n=1 Tax=Fonticula alba TaxID=691883 RepID=A0A058ZF27_FONAL|nr:hypothetical protein H696_00147 [Fonticula alba]KCV72556.1 hypothetical protein H696_00147 [Fonticula alba]|eukprot:XP_009492257.1 hypothetical protein H696_00147 [Fonticula alba]